MIPRVARVLALCAATSGCIRARAPSPASLPPMREVALTIEASIEEIPAGAQDLRLWIPVPRDEGAQVLLRVVPETPGAPVVVTDSRGNPALLVRIRSPASTATAAATFEVSRAAQRGAGTPHPLAYAEKRASPDEWLADESLVKVDDRIRAIATEVFAGAKTHSAKARAAWSYVLGEMRGDCTDFHALFIALMRAGGVPARFRVGFSLPPDEREGTITGHHCWAEWWNPDRGWTPVDASEAWKHAERRERFFGSLDADRVGISLGRDLVFEGQQGPPLDSFVFPYAEIDGAPVRVKTTVRFRDRS